jgi:hypothetical protein
MERKFMKRVHYEREREQKLPGTESKRRNGKSPTYMYISMPDHPE